MYILFDRHTYNIYIYIFNGYYILILWPLLLIPSWASAIDPFFLRTAPQPPRMGGGWARIRYLAYNSEYVAQI